VSIVVQSHSNQVRSWIRNQNDVYWSCRVNVGDLQALKYVRTHVETVRVIRVVLVFSVVCGQCSRISSPKIFTVAIIGRDSDADFSIGTRLIPKKLDVASAENCHCFCQKVFCDVSQLFGIFL